MNNPAEKNQIKREDPAKNLTGDAPRSNVEQKEKNQTEDTSAAKSSQAGYTDQSGNARSTQVDADDASV